MEPWLNQDDLLRYIGRAEVPASFSLNRITPAIVEVVKGWLSDLIDVSTLAVYKALFYTSRIQFSYDNYADIPTVDENGNAVAIVTAEQFVTGSLIAKFFAYAAWAEYCKTSNAINTDTGYVSKLNDDSERISDRQRVELAGRYIGLAERAALELSQLRKVDAICPDGSGYSGRPTIRKAQPRSPSRLGN